MKEDTVADVALLDVGKSYGPVEAVRGLSLSIADGEFVVLLGPTGAGKTTTLRMIAGLERPDRGNVVIAGRDVTHEMPAERDVAFVFQQYSLYPHLTVYDNLAFPLRSPARRVDEPTIRRRIQQVAELLHIEQKLANRATALSGGEMQRVAIGRALVREPAVYLMDEPLSSLDAKLRAELRLELKRIQREFGTTILYVTHDQIEAMTMADRIGVMSEGALIQLGTPREIYEQPNSAYVAGRLGTPAINLIPAELLGIGVMPQQARTVGLRTEHIRISPAAPQEASAAPRAEVQWVEHLGDQNHVHLKLATHSLVTLADPVQPLKAGDQVSIEFTEPLYFDEAGNRIASDGLRGQA
jgi:multiple sugar transport system ATP-binding protein